MSKTYTAEDVDSKLHRCPGKNAEESAQIINDIIINLRDMVNKIESGEIINIRGFTSKVKSTCSNLFTEDFHGSGTHDTKDFYNNIMEILGLETTNHNIENIYLFNYTHAQTLLDEPYIKIHTIHPKKRVVEG